MQNVTPEQKHVIEGQVNLAEHLSAMIFNQIGQVRVGLNDPGFTQDELTKLVTGFQHETYLLMDALDRIQESI